MERFILVISIMIIVLNCYTSIAPTFDEPAPVFLAESLFLQIHF